MAEEKLDIYQKIAQFLINVRTNRPREIMCHCIVIGILGEHEGRLDVDEVVSSIKAKWELAVPKERVGSSLKSLQKSKWLHGEKGKYFMDEEQKERYGQAINNRVAFFKEVEQEWLDGMQRIGKIGDLEEGIKVAIIDDFRAALDGLCELHSGRIASFLTGTSTELDHPFLGKEIIDCLPPCNVRTDEILSIEKKIFPLFFQSSDPRRCRYLAGMAQTYLRKTIFEVETRGRSIFGAKLREINVFLDTNMIFHLLGLNGVEQEDIVANIISINKSLGIDTMVDRCSIREFRNVLENSRRQNIGPRVPVGIFREVKRAIQEPGYEPQIPFALPDDPFVLMFWASLDDDFVKKSRNKDFSQEWARFLAGFEAVTIILSVKYGINVVNTSDEVITDTMDLAETVESVLEAAKAQHVRKRETTAKHDATLLVVVKILREDETPVLLPSNYWILSADKSLKTHEKRMLREGTIELSRIVPAACWTELMMPFLTMQLVDQSKDAAVIAKTLGEPFEHLEVEKVHPKEIAEVLRRVPEAYERGAELVLRCAAHRHFCETVGTAVSAEGSTSAMVDEAVIKAFEGVREKMESGDSKLIEEIKVRAASERMLGEKLEEERKGREIAEVRLENLERFLLRVGLSVILLMIAAGASYLGYRIISPSFSGANLNAVFWMVGNIYIFLWVVLCVMYKNVTLRIIAGTFLAGVGIFTIPLFWIYSGNTGELIGTVTFFLAVAGVGAYLIKKSWLDIRILLRRRNNS